MKWYKYIAIALVMAAGLGVVEGAEEKDKLFFERAGFRGYNPALDPEFKDLTAARNNGTSYKLIAQELNDRLKALGATGLRASGGDTKSGGIIVVNDRDDFLSMLYRSREVISVTAAITAAITVPLTWWFTRRAHQQ